MNILKTARSITIAPITSDKTKAGYINYQREIALERGGNHSPRWDDAQDNKTQIGDLFAYVQGQSQKNNVVGDGIAEIRRVVGLGHPNSIPSYWTHNTRGRNILVLGPVECTMTWIELRDYCGKRNTIRAGCNPPQMCTQRWKL